MMMKKKEKKLRKKIAKQVADKMYYMNTCLNERDIILGIICKDREFVEPHCFTDCTNVECGRKIQRIMNRITIDE